MKFHSTGEVAKKLNISVRTLRYYDQIGLMSPSQKLNNGKRLYSDNDLLRLEKITILKLLDLPLNDIRKILLKITTEQLLYAHRDSLKEKIEELHAAIQNTNTILNTIYLEGELKWEQLVPLINAAQKKEAADKKWNEYFDQQEQSTLKERLPKLEQDSPQVRKWITLVRRIELCLARGDEPESEEGQIIAEEALLLSNEMFAGCEELGDKFYEIRRSPEKSKEINLYPVKEEVLHFMEEAIQIYEKNPQVSN
ncbi:MerR family transcriptional regulator [Sediminibacillus albus]|uniref:DNA-binding transcriptional regulator, MerR family n=1 Tax=Sediminibacillus albus TaxID=407036 RepID=A0A1G9C4Q8_9BACI|nr:MerR family transcriptional regulator [Sediminibacillus albus]SDK46626.1 DNA-binding transcriptional regulator, MerR family [Sediminibacillus albus]